MYEAITKKPAKMLESFSLNATLLLMGLLTIDPQCRLGTSQFDAEEIKSQPFFEGVDWETVYTKDYEPPMKPQIDGPLDTRYFQSNNVQNEPFNEIQIRPEADKKFSDFDFKRE